MKKEVTLFWFRRDLRLNNNAGLYYALKENENVLPVFIFDKKIPDQLEDEQDRRVDIIHKALEKMQEELISPESSLQLFYDTPEKVFKALLKQYSIKSVCRLEKMRARRFNF